MKELMFKSEIAQHLKSLRKRKGLSLDATARLTGVSKAMLGQIERQESSPTIATLWKIASGLETSFSAFFTAGSEVQPGELVFPEDKNMVINTLFPYQADARIEMFEVTLKAYHQQMSSPHSHGIIEHVHVLRGELKVFFEEQWHHLTAGESLRFFADQPHGYEAVSEEAVFQNIVCYP